PRSDDGAKEPGATRRDGLRGKSFWFLLGRLPKGTPPGGRNPFQQTTRKTALRTRRGQHNHGRATRASPKAHASAQRHPTTFPVQPPQPLPDRPEIALSTLDLHPPLGLQQPPQLLVELTGQVVQLLLTLTAAGFEAAAFGGLGQAVALVEQFGRAAEEAAVAQQLFDGAT